MEEFARFQKDPSVAVDALMIGDSPAAKIDATRTAALMQVIVAMYNLEEAMTKT